MLADLEDLGPAVGGLVRARQLTSPIGVRCALKLVVICFALLAHLGGSVRRALQFDPVADRIHKMLRVHELGAEWDTS